MVVNTEGVGHHRDFLESTLLVSDEGRRVSMKAPTFISNPGDSSRPADRKMLDFSSPNCQAMLRSFIPNCVKKCAHYRHDRVGFLNNVRNLVSVLSKKAYPPPCSLA